MKRVAGVLLAGMQSACAADGKDSRKKELMALTGGKPRRLSGFRK